MEIRPYQQNDKEAVVRLLKLNSPKFFAPSEEEDLVKYLNEEVEDYFVVEVNHEIIGAGGINYFPEEKIARISWDFIQPNFQGKGIGKKLLEMRMNHLAKNKNIDLIIVRTTQLAYKFYEKMGFKLTEVKKNFWAKDFDLYQMELNNNPH